MTNRLIPMQDGKRSSLNFAKNAVRTTHPTFSTVPWWQRKLKMLFQRCSVTNMNQRQVPLFRWTVCVEWMHRWWVIIQACFLFCSLKIVLWAPEHSGNDPRSPVDLSDLYTACHSFSCCSSGSLDLPGKPWNPQWGWNTKKSDSFCPISFFPFSRFGGRGGVTQTLVTEGRAHIQNDSGASAERGNCAVGGDITILGAQKW